MYIVKVATESGHESCGVAFQYWSNAERYVENASGNLASAWMLSLPREMRPHLLNVYDIGTRPPITRISSDKKFWLDAERMHLVKSVPMRRSEWAMDPKRVILARSHAETDMDY